MKKDTTKRKRASKPSTKETKRVSAEVSAVLNVFEEKTPDFITDAVVAAIDEACERLGINAPTYDENPKTGDSQTGNILTELFAKTKFYKPKSADEKQRVVEATAEILRNPQAPSDLFCAVAEFVTEAMNKENQKDLEPGQPELLHTAPILTILLDTYPEDELRGAVIAARKEGQS